MSSAQAKPWTALLTLYALQLAGLVLFIRGFFPYKTNLAGFASLSDIPPLPNGQAVSYEPLFDRLVFVVVDALRRLVGTGSSLCERQRSLLN
jgi:ethanolaminephosphotransferase